MSRNQKFAWFNLAVIALSLISVFSLVPSLGWQRAQGGLGIAGLMGLGVLFYRKRPGEVVMDERDNLIFKRSYIWGHGLFWLAYVAVSVGLAPAVYGWEGAVPVSVVQTSVFWAMFLVQASMSIAILAQYAGDSKKVE